MLTINVGDTVKNINGWQGKVIEVKGNQCLVEYASRRKWEHTSLLYVAVSAQDDCKKTQSVV
jgi:preprotein translocase subunit YajC